MPLRPLRASFAEHRRPVLTGNHCLRLRSADPAAASLALSESSINQSLSVYQPLNPDSLGDRTLFSGALLQALVPFVLFYQLREGSGAMAGEVTIIIEA